LLVILVGLLGILILSPLEIVIESLYLLVQVFFVVSQTVKLPLSVQTSTDILSKLPEGKVS
jgi:hypothetical protein